MTQDAEVREATSTCEAAPDREAAARDERYADVDTDHLEAVEDGCGCVELWEHVSVERGREQGREREQERDGGDDADAGADDGAD